VYHKVICAVLAAGVAVASLAVIARRTLPYYCDAHPIELCSFYAAYYSPWCYRVPLIALALYVVWRVASWLDRRKSQAG